MALFKITDNKLKSIGSKDFKLERDIQRLLEANLESIFGLQFISTEFALENLRLDTIAYDPERKSFVIIEYKRDKSSSVVDQGYSYLSLVLNNKADFVLEYNERKKKTATKKDFDWSAVRVIFVANRFTPHQLGAINFQDLPIELWEARRYEGDLLSLEQRLAETTAVSIKTINKRTTTNETTTVQKEIKTYTIDDVFPARKEVQRSIFDELDQLVKALDDNIVDGPRKYYVGYRIGSDWRNFIALNPFNQGIRIDILRTKPKDLNDPERKLAYKKDSLKLYGNDISYMHINSTDDIEYALSIIRQAYKKHIQEFGS